MTEFNDDNEVTPQKPKNEFIEECSKDVAELKPLPSIGKAFLIYAVIPLALFILPELIDRILKMDFTSSATALFGSSNITSKSSSSSHIISSSDQRRPIVNIDKELQYLQNMKENTRRRNEQQTREAEAKRNAQSPTIGRNSQKQKMDDHIAAARKVFKNNPNDLFHTLHLADLLRNRDLTYHDGGSVREEAVDTYQHAIEILLLRREVLINQGLSTNELSDPEAAQWVTKHGGDEFFIFDYRRKSVDGLLCVVYTSLGKVLYMASMFEDAVGATNQALIYKPNDLDALNQRASTFIILGKYKEAAEDYLSILALDKSRIFADAFTGLAKVLTAKEEVVPGGWNTLVTILNEHIPIVLLKWQQSSNTPELRSRTADHLKRMHLAMFQYYDVKVNDTELAWLHLEKAQQFKMSTVEPFNSNTENYRIKTIIDIFQPGIWTPGVGSDSIAPIFVIGFVRSGSTLLERILDSHYLIAGTGEDSIFNGQLEQIRGAIVEASTRGPMELQRAILAQADYVLSGMKERWEKTTAASLNGNKGELIAPQRFVDKMLTNYLNVGFIHMLFPKALILHVARNPMDTIFSSYKHDFAPGHLDYLSDFESLAQTYGNYRKVMSHWDTVLPGRVTHVRYEDIVNDLPGMAKSIVAATGLGWDPEVLNFHMKKHAVNTLSTTQVRKAVYKDGMNSWLRYEKYLEPLVKLVGENVNYPLRTSLPGYQPPQNE